MFPGCGCVRFVFVFFLYFFFLCAFIYNLMISGTHLLAPSLSLVISYNEDGYNEDDVRQLLRAPDFEDIWSQLFRLASAYHRAKKKKKNEFQIFTITGASVLLIVHMSRFQAAARKQSFFLFYLLRCTVKMSKSVPHICFFLHVRMLVLQHGEAGLCSSKPQQTRGHAD